MLTALQVCQSQLELAMELGSAVDARELQNWITTATRVSSVLEKLGSSGRVQGAEAAVAITGLALRPMADDEV
jgi:hypothetical protein